MSSMRNQFALKTWHCGARVTHRKIHNSWSWKLLQGRRQTGCKGSELSRVSSYENFLSHSGQWQGGKMIAAK